MKREKIKGLLAKIEVDEGVFGVTGNESPKAINALQKSVPITWFEQFANLVSQETLESAAKECEDTDIEEDRSGMSYYAQLGDASATRASIAAAIRNLKETL